MISKKCPQCSQTVEVSSARCPNCSYNFFGEQYSTRTEHLSEPITLKARPNQSWKIATLVLVAIMIVGLGGIIVAMPVLTLWNMSRAAKAKDGATFATYIDFPKLRENLKADLNAQMLENMSKNQDKNNPFSGLAAMIGPTIINNMVDAYVTPAGVEKMMSGNFAPNLPQQGASPASPGFLPDTSNYEYVYSGLNEFDVKITHPNSTVLLTFERNSLIFWKLVRAQFRSK